MPTFLTLAPAFAAIAPGRPRAVRESFTRESPHAMVRPAVATDDLTLVQRVRQGDQRAFKTLVERYQRKVYGVALGMVKDKEEAKDVAQEAFVKVYKYLDHFKGDSSFYTWLYRITVNICIDVLRRKGSARGDDHVEFDESVRLDTSEANLGALGSRLGTNPQKAALRKELADRITQAIHEIPEAHRKILLLREVEGMSYEDLSRVLDIPKGTVMSRLFHARLKMQKILGEYLELDEARAGVGHEG
jgi:RNA polymerase sigma-70 factor (ECF subfamily)